MISVRNQNSDYGDAGPFEVESAEAFADEMQPAFVQWAGEAWQRECDLAADCGESVGTTREKFVAREIERMRCEFLLGLEVVGGDEETT